MNVIAWLDSLNKAQQFLIGLPVLVAALFTMWKFSVRPTVLFVRQLKDCICDVATIKAAVGPNGGRSLYDKVEAGARAARLIEARLSSILDVVVDRPMFIAGEDGSFSWVNKAFERTFETTLSDAAGRGWINLLLPEDRDRVVKEWIHAVRDKRAFNTRARCLTNIQSALLMGRWSAEPVLDPADDELIGWIGTIEARAVPPALAEVRE